MQLLDMFKTLTAEQRAEVLAQNPDLTEAFEALAQMEFYQKMFDDPTFYSKVQRAVCAELLRNVFAKEAAV